MYHRLSLGERSIHPSTRQSIRSSRSSNSISMFSFVITDMFKFQYPIPQFPTHRRKAPQLICSSRGTAKGIKEFSTQKLFHLAQMPRVIIHPDNCQNREKGNDAHYCYKCHTLYLFNLFLTNNVANVSIYSETAKSFCLFFHSAPLRRCGVSVSLRALPLLLFLYSAGGSCRAPPAE